MTKSIILLSGGLDSLVSLGMTRVSHNIELALTFDYGQKSVSQEIDASRVLCKYYDVKHKIIKLDFLKEITHTALCSDEEVPTGEALSDENQSAKSVWVPNRNGLFLNIAGAFADSEDYDYIIIGANSEEAKTFPDNTEDFINRVNMEFEYSTRKNPKVLAPLLKMNKNDIVKQALSQEMPLKYVRSCYNGTEKHCGICESCMRLKNALLYNGDRKFVKELFE